MKATFDASRGEYTIDGATVEAVQVRGAAESVARQSQVELAKLADRLAAGQIELQEFYDSYKRETKYLHMASAAMARGGFDQMRAQDWRRVETIVAAQWNGVEGKFPGLRAFAQDIQNGRYGTQQLGRGFNSRAGAYAEAGRSTYENERLAARIESGPLEARRQRGAADHCVDCNNWAALGWISAEEMYRSYPIGASECNVKCISTPWSRVITRRGLVSICEIKIGDIVLTHKHNWQPVTAVMLSFSTPDHKQAWVKSPNGATIGCTSDHEFFTSQGWQRIGELGEGALLMYTYKDENLHSMRQIASSGLPKLNLQNLSFGLRLRREKGLSRQRVQALRHQNLGARAVGRFAEARKDSECDSTVRGQEKNSLRGFNGGEFSLLQTGWQSLRFLLGRRGKASQHLSLSMVMDSIQWFLQKGIGFASYQRGLHGRQAGKSGLTHVFGARRHSYDERQNGRISGGGRAKIERQNDFSMPGLRTRISRIPAQWFTPSLLLEEMPVGTPLYDIEVANDHSFILEGVAVHNCHCAIRTRESSAENQIRNLIQTAIKIAAPAAFVGGLLALGVAVNSAGLSPELRLLLLRIFRSDSILKSSLRTTRTVLRRLTVEQLAVLKQPHPFSPSGTSISSAIDLTGITDKFANRQWVIDALDRVIGDGQLGALSPRIIKSALGEYFAGLSPSMGFDLSDVTIGNTTLHEIGHWLHDRALGFDPYEPGFEFGGFTGYPELISALRETKEVIDLEKLKGLAKAKKGLIGTIQTGSLKGKKIDYLIDLKYVDYLLKSEELFARAFAQYIAVRAGNDRLLIELQALLQNPGTTQFGGPASGDLFYAVQWSAEEFEQIAALFDKLFIEKGWIKPQ